MEDVAQNLMRREQLETSAQRRRDSKDDVQRAPQTMRLPELQPLILRQLSTTYLRALAASAELNTVDAARAELLASLTAAITNNSKQQWVMKDAEGSGPGRMKGLLVSYGNALYLYGGMPHTAFTSTRNLSATSFAYPEGETIFMKLQTSAGSPACWQSVSCEGAVPESRTRIHSGHTGVVLGETLYLVGNLQSLEPDEQVGIPTAIVMCCFNFPSQKWTRLRPGHAPEVCHYPLLAAHEEADQLILFGGQTALYENIPANQALWSFDISTSTWQQRHPTGVLPGPHQAQALAVHGGKAYALVNEPERSKRLEVYELDLATWHWRKLPGHGSQPSCRRAASAVVMQGCWLLHGGLWTGEAYSSFHVFDFEKLSWSSPKLMGDAAQPRYYHMATCHNDTLVVLGGLDYMRPEYERLQQVDTVQCIWRQPTPHIQDFEDNTLQNWQAGSAMREMYEQQLFTDATVLVQGQQLQAHRAVLAAVSPVFLRMFSSQMQEGISQSIVMEDMDAEAAGLLLQWVYGNPLTHLGLTGVVALFQASDKYAISSLHLQCTRLLKGMITYHNLYELAGLAQLHHCDDLHQACRQYMASLQELEGILGNDICSQLRSDARYHSLLASQPSEQGSGKSWQLDRPLSAGGNGAGPAYNPQHSRLTV